MKNNLIATMMFLIVALSITVACNSSNTDSNQLNSNQNQKNDTTKYLLKIFWILTGKMFAYMKNQKK